MEPILITAANTLRVGDGRVVDELAPGRHRVWTKREEVSAVDMREQASKVNGQEVLTRDGIPVKVSVTLTFRSLGARAERAVADWHDAFRLAAQHALRDAAAKVTLDQVMADRAVMDAFMTDELRARAGQLALAEVRAAVRDVMVGGELKRALTEVTRARIEGKARLERARSETAAMRSLTNAARLLEEHAGLAKLQLIQAAQAAAESPGNQLVLHIDQDAAEA